jgi:hypothetical protein
VPVCGQLNAIIEPTSQVHYELACRASIAPSNVPARNKLCLRIDGRPRPNVAISEFAWMLDRDVLLFGVAEGPDFIALDAAAIQIPEVFILILLAGFASCPWACAFRVSCIKRSMSASRILLSPYPARLNYEPQLKPQVFELALS